MAKSDNTNSQITDDDSPAGGRSSAQVVEARDGSTIRDVIQAVISGDVTGDVHIGNKVYTRSSLEELNDYLTRAVAAYEARLSQAVLRPTLPDHPYKFLYSFDVEDAPIFFGRDAAIEQLYGKTRQDRLTILHARSGAGKTSLLNAGLSPRLIHEGRLSVYARAYQDPYVLSSRR